LAIARAVPMNEPRPVTERQRDERLPGGFDEVRLALLESLPFAVFVKDLSFRYLYVNELFLELAGRDATEILGRTDADFMPGDVALRYLGTDEFVVASGEPLHVDNDLFVDSHGRSHLLATTKLPLRDRTGRVAHIAGVVNDLTLLSRHEDALRVANEELERRVRERTDALRAAQQQLLRKERLAVLGQLAGGLAHQIRNPLAAISNAASVLKRRLGEHGDPDVAQAISIIHEEIWEANRIITDLLDYARIRPPSMRSTEIGELLQSALTLARPGDDIAIVRRIDSLARAMVDERQMRDALGNVLRNAVEAMPQGGTLTLEVSVDGELVRIAIEDTGPGLSNESLAYLFEPLVTSKPLGLGLGLTTAKALIENQSGTIRCSIGDGTGARFDIEVPRATLDG
jgi:PAS domain S-box-containing protein